MSSTNSILTSSISIISPTPSCATSDCEKEGIETVRKEVKYIS